ncbi:MAG TPA: transglutaminase family protein [Pirellulales bacterium]|nr:transglutaminase family protein [Pirellulales bacterium]
MDYKISHTTVYSYAEAVPYCHNEVHLTPRDHLRQSCISNRLAIKPQPKWIESVLDYFGNSVSFFTVEEGHQRLSVTALSKVRVTELPQLAPSKMPWEAVRDQLAIDRSPAVLEAYQYAFESPHVPTAPELAAYAATSFAPGRPWLESLLHLTRRIYSEFKYDKSATNIRTSPLEVLRLRRGVCQDFAHLQIACLRSLGLPVRYVSGYLVTSPPPGQPRLVGADASHAWISAFSPEHGWIDVDPTNDLIPSLKHVSLAWGRDYSDVSPIKGVYIGGGHNGMTVAVDVMPLPADGAG